MDIKKTSIDGGRERERTGKQAITKNEDMLSKLRER